VHEYRKRLEFSRSLYESGVNVWIPTGANEGFKLWFPKDWWDKPHDCKNICDANPFGDNRFSG